MAYHPRVNARAPTDDYDVLLAGYGPTGMMAALLLGRAGHRVAVIERYTTLYNLPRVGIIHDDIMRMFQETGCMEPVLPHTHFLPTYELARNGRVLMSSKVATLATHGWPEFTSVYQPAFEAALDRLVQAEPTVDVFQGYTVAGLEQDADGVDVTTEAPDGAKARFRGRFLIGADGGNSFVRRALGVEYTNLGFDQDWLVIDGRALRPQRKDLPMLRQFCEPEQPGMTLRMGPDHRRWSFMILPGEPAEEAMKPENVWRRLSRPEGATPEEFELIRVASYKFASLLAEQWRVGRVLLAGDAAHQMPPFLAQGLCSGFRDAHNLAWKLDLVLKGSAEPALLDAYAAERLPNTKATIIESARVGQNVIERDLEKARARDEQLARLWAENEARSRDKQLIAFRVPGYQDGVIAGDGTPGAGDALGQARVRLADREGLFDDVAGRGWMLLARSPEAAAGLSEAGLAFWRSLGGRTCIIGTEGEGAIEDVEGYYGRLFDEYGCDAMLKRPDYYLFGTAKGPDGLTRLLTEIRRRLVSV
jgi:2-polyprenyl-6-methoxyphenol hydroxylase-like FAD-dependent oxidoreductase